MAEQSTRKRLEQLLRAGTSDTLAECALLIAQTRYPDLPVGEYLGRLDAMAQSVSELAAGTAPAQRLEALNLYLFKRERFAGNIDDYYDPRNSFLNEVLDRRLGIPITLSILYIAVGRRLGLDLHGISFPGHFLVKWIGDSGETIVDPFSGGGVLSQEDLRERLRAFRGSEAHPLASLLVPASEAEILVRMLRNLKNVYLQRKELENALAMLDLILFIMPGLHDEQRDRGLIYLRLDCYRAALTDLEAYLAAASNPRDAESVRGHVLRALQALRSLH